MEKQTGFRYQVNLEAVVGIFLQKVMLVPETGIGCMANEENNA